MRQNDILVWDGFEKYSCVGKSGGDGLCFFFLYSRYNVSRLSVSSFSAAEDRSDEFVRGSSLVTTLRYHYRRRTRRVRPENMIRIRATRPKTRVIYCDVRSTNRIENCLIVDGIVFKRAHSWHARPPTNASVRNDNPVKHVACRTNRYRFCRHRDDPVSAFGFLFFFSNFTQDGFLLIRIIIITVEFTMPRCCY